MGQKVNPISNRLGIIRGWDSNWADSKNQVHVAYMGAIFALRNQGDDIQQLVS